MNNEVKDSGTKRSSTLTPLVQWRIYKGDTITVADVKTLRDAVQFMHIPEVFFSEMESYAKRNVMHIPQKINGNNVITEKVCLRCFKAHLVTTATKMEISNLMIDFLAQQFHCDMGHNTFYTDRDDLVKIAYDL